MQSRLLVLIRQSLDLHRNLFGQIAGFSQRMSSERLIGGAGGFGVEEFPILFTDPMGTKFALPYYIYRVYDVCDHPNSVYDCSG